MCVCILWRWLNDEDNETTGEDKNIEDVEDDEGIGDHKDDDDWISVDRVTETID